MSKQLSNSIANKQKRIPKGEVTYEVVLDEDQKVVKSLIHDNQVVVVTGRAGSGKSLVCVIAAIDLFFKRQVEKILVTRAAIETGRSLGYLPGDLGDKFNPYLEAFMENVKKSIGVEKQKSLEGKIQAMPVQFIRGKTIDDVLVVEEAQNLTKHEVLAIITRLGKEGKIIFNGDLEQKDTNNNGDMNGLSYLYSLSKAIPDIKLKKLQHQHRSDLVGKILDWEYKDKS